MKAKVMKKAWYFVRNMNMSMSEALRKAWALIKVVKAMTTKVVNFVYRKKDGTLRTANGTLMSDLVPATHGASRTSEKVQVYYDTDVNNWRSFLTANIVGYAM